MIEISFYGLHGNKFNFSPIAMVNITVRFRDYFETFENIQEEFEFNSPTDLPIFASFSPSVLLGRTKVNSLYFTEIRLISKAVIQVSPQNIKVRIPPRCKSLLIELSDPSKPKIKENNYLYYNLEYGPINELVNVSQKNTSSIYFVNIFDPFSSQYIGTSAERWTRSLDSIKAILNSNGFATKNIYVGVLKEEGVSPSLQLLESCFSRNPSGNWGRMILNIVVESDDESKRWFLLLIPCRNSFYLDSFYLGDEKIMLLGLPALPLKIAQTGSNMLKQEPDNADCELWRRISVAALNCGVVAPLLETLLARGNTIRINPRHFDCRIADLDLAEAKANPFFNVELFRSELRKLAHFIKPNSNEATWCSNFWFPLIHRCFELIDNDQIINYNIQTELSTRAHLNPNTASKVDFAVTISLGPSELNLPILMIEAGKETVLAGIEHKDSSKENCLLSLATYCLAYELIKAGKKPELAVTYGILIGGSKCQFLVAHAKVRRISDGTFEIYTVVSYHDHWVADIYDGPVTSSDCRGPCCFPGTTNQTGPAGEIADATSRSLNSIHWFISRVKEHINNLLSSHPDNIDRSKRQFAPQRSQGSIPSARSSSTQSSPNRSRLRPDPTNQYRLPATSDSGPPTSPLVRCFIQVKKDPFESNVYCRCAALFTHVFPRLYSFKQTETPEGPLFEYLFERMEPFAHEGHFLSSEFFDRRDEFKFISECLRFSIHILYGLHLLHTQLKIVHSDVKPSNIMYSRLDNVWKLIDFNQSEPIEDSLKTARTAGTELYWAPECSRGTGIFSPASDIFSFGKLLERAFFVPLVQITCFSEHQSVELRAGNSAITDLMDEAAKGSPNERPAALEALRMALRGLGAMDPAGKVTDFVIDSAKVLLELNPVAETKQVALLTGAADLKRTNLESESEKDIQEFNIQNIVQ